jgi:hypothetical protein
MNNKMNYLLIIKNAGLIYILATLVNIGFYYIAMFLGGFKDLTNTPIATFGIMQLIISSFVFTILGTIIYMLCHLFYKRNPNKLFSILGYTFLILMIVSPLILPINNIEKIYFELSHIVLGVPFIEYMRASYLPKVIV